MKVRHEVAIVGAGPAGIAAAIYLQRSSITPLLFEQARIGGLLNNAFLVENYPGFPSGIAGKNLVRKFRQHLLRWGISVVKERVTSVCKNKDSFILQAKKKYRAQLLIIASGTKPKLPELDIKDIQKKILFEIYPIRNIKKKRIIIVGAGDAALDYALNLGRYNKVTILNRSDDIKGLRLLYQRIRKSNNRRKGAIKYLKNIKILVVKKLNDFLTTQVLNNGKKTTLYCDYMVYAIGREPAVDFLPYSMRRQLPDGDNKRIFFVGDVRQGNLRQTAIAIGDGIKAAMKICEYLKLQKVLNKR